MNLRSSTNRSSLSWIALATVLAFSGSAACGSNDVASSSAAGANASDSGSDADIDVRSPNDAGHEGGSSPDAGYVDGSSPDAGYVDGSSPDAGEAASAQPDSGACGWVSEENDIPDVHITFDDPGRCRFTLAEAAAGIAIPYTVIVDRDVTGFEAAPYPYGSDVANLAITATLSGNGQAYCVCDRGVPDPGCPLDDGGVGHSADSGAGPAICPPVTLPAGVYRRTFTWDGRNWGGPSDTSNPEGAPFGPGSYLLEVSTAPGSIGDAGGLRSRDALAIELVP